MNFILSGIDNLEDIGLKKKYLTASPILQCKQCKVKFFPPKLRGPLDIHCMYCEALLIRLETEDDWVEFGKGKLYDERPPEYTGVLEFKR